MPDTQRATFDQLLAFANKVREAGGGNPLDALMPSVPQDASQCLIARNLNFNCEVSGADRDGRWYMNIEDPATVEAIAEKLDLEIRYGHQWIEGQYTEVARSLLLPVEIGNVARDFDEAQEIYRGLQDRADEIAYDRTNEWGNASKEDYQRAFNDLDEESKQHLREFTPYIEASEHEAYSLATIVNDDGSIVV